MPAEIVAQRAEHRREHKLHDRIERGHDPNIRRDILDVRDKLREIIIDRPVEIEIFSVRAVGRTRCRLRRCCEDERT
jgi:hypothetical protein